MMVVRDTSQIKFRALIKVYSRSFDKSRVGNFEENNTIYDAAL
jgi:hypothetical protein